MVICLELGADLHMAQQMPLPLTVSCFSKIQIGFTFLVPAHPGSPGKRAVKRVCVCMSMVTAADDASGECIQQCWFRPRRRRLHRPSSRRRCRRLYPQRLLLVATASRRTGSHERHQLCRRCRLAGFYCLGVEKQPLNGFLLLPSVH